MARINRPARQAGHCPARRNGGGPSGPEPVGRHDTTLAGGRPAPEFEPCGRIAGFEQVPARPGNNRVGDERQLVHQPRE